MQIAIVEGAAAEAARQAEDHAMTRGKWGATAFGNESTCVSGKAAAVVLAIVPSVDNENCQYGRG
jgi:hypothetical protein